MNDLSITFPLQKIDKQKRIVTGIATANNVDKEDDLISFEASMEAFSNWVGNVREMHDPKNAVGSILDWRPTRILYKGKEYDAIEVDVYISKGSENTWQKILDKTLKGFSIRGRALERKSKFDNELGRMVNVVTKYRLDELSVVDNPCNPAGMFLLIKSAPDGSLVLADEDESEKDVFYCSDHQYATLETSICPSCVKDMEKIGVVKEFDADVINKMISDHDLYLKGGSSNTMDLQEKDNSDIVSNMDVELTDEMKESIGKRFVSALFSKSDTTSASDVIVPNITINIEKSITEEEVESTKDDTKEDIVQKSEDLKDDVEDEIEKVSDDKEDNTLDTEEILKGFGALLDEKFTQLKAEVDEQISEISKSVDEFKEETSATITETKDEIEKVANTGAEKKSVDIDDEVDEDLIEKNTKTESFWGGVFVPQEITEALGYES